GVSRQLLRTTSISSITQASDWDDPTKAAPIGPVLPPSLDGTEPVVQVSGGHFNPVFYVAFDTGFGNKTGTLFKLDRASNSWKKIAPGGPTGRESKGPISFFADPYHSEIIYLVDSSGILVSLDGGDSWLPELGLQQTMTAGSKLIRN